MAEETDGTACLCGRAVGVDKDGKVSQHRPRRYFKDGRNMKRRDRKSMWCGIPEIISKAVTESSVAIA